LPETVQGYPKWRGELSRSPRLHVVAFQEARRASENQWIRAAFLFCVGLAGIRLAIAQGRSPTYDNLLGVISLLRWAALLIASIMAGPALMEDSRRGALELYRSRGVGALDYLAGKALAVWVFSFAAIAVPMLLYYGASYMLSDAQPGGWSWAWLGIIGDAAIFSLVVTALGLGLSAAARSARAATIVLFGSIALLDILFGQILNAITKAPEVLVLSPLAAMARQAVWLYPKAKAPYEFPFWWGLIELGLLFLVGILLVAWRQPRVRGVE
jgi:hypothetical protein